MHDSAVESFCRSPGLTLIIGCLLLSLVSNRHYATLMDGRNYSQTVPKVIVEMSGGSNTSGMYFFAVVPTLQEVLEVSGIKQLSGRGFDSARLRPVESGTKVSISFCTNEPSITFMPMAAGKRIALGIPIDVNTATAEDLILISGVGAESARKIIDYRTGVGRFTRIEQLKNVKGIGEKRFQWIRKYIFVSSER